MGSTEICKVADFGLLREIPRDDSIYHSQHNVPCPIRWMPPESISDRHFSPASDVWSFGVLVWEMFNPTKLPYAKYDNIGCATKVGEAVLFDVVEGMHDSFDLFIYEAMCMWYECNEYIPGRGITLIIIIHVLMRDEKEERKKQARSRKCSQCPHGCEVDLVLSLSAPLPPLSPFSPYAPFLAPSSPSLSLPPLSPFSPSPLSLPSPPTPPPSPLSRSLPPPSRSLLPPLSFPPPPLSPPLSLSLPPLSPFSPYAPSPPLSRTMADSSLANSRYTPGSLLCNIIYCLANVHIHVHVHAVIYNNIIIAIYVHCRYTMQCCNDVLAPTILAFH